MGKLHGPVWPPLPRPNFTALIMAEHTSEAASAASKGEGPGAEGPTAADTMRYASDCRSKEDASERPLTRPVSHPLPARGERAGVRGS